jgi:hypothetical protein
MVERLPNFIKFAKNREVIIKVIDKLSIKWKIHDSPLSVSSLTRIWNVVSGDTDNGN